MVKRKDDLDLLESSIRRVALGKMVTTANANRPLRPGRVNKLVTEMDLDQIGLPVLSFRDDKHYIIDGQHRIKALEKWLGGGWERQQIECRVYTGLTEQQEANLFDRLNDVLPVSTFDKFRVRVTAGRPVETAIKNIVEAEGLKIAPPGHHPSGGVSCVGTLTKVFMRTDGQNLRTTLALIRDAWGDSGLQAAIISGVSLVVQRYPGLSRDRAVKVLGATRGGPTGLLGRAHVLQKQTGNDLPSCVAAATVDILNSHRGGQKLPSWWRPKKAKKSDGEAEVAEAAGA